ncbi:MAG: DNA-deoxyinosine glycosylase [Anaerolineales bacterium]|nr:DNA-deoxyinosine glycosylase [Anaerolineales bacterium]
MRIESFPPISDKSSRIALLGTMPGEKSLQTNTYFASNTNQFWKILFTLLNQEFSDDYFVRKQLLLANRIALWDVLKACSRETDAPHPAPSSLDKYISQEVPNDFVAFYAEHPQIQHVFFLGQKARAAYEKHVVAPAKILHVLPSPSGANTSMSFQQKVAEWKVVLKFIDSPLK